MAMEYQLRPPSLFCVTIYFSKNPSQDKSSNKFIDV